MPSLQKIYPEIRQNGLVILLINVKEHPSKVRNAVEQRAYALPVLLDIQGAAAQAYGVWGTPAVYLIDSRGRVVAGGMGPHHWDSAEGVRVLKSLGSQPGIHERVE